MAKEKMSQTQTSTKYAEPPIKLIGRFTAFYLPHWHPSFGDQWVYVFNTSLKTPKPSLRRCPLSGCYCPELFWSF